MIIKYMRNCYCCGIEEWKILQEYDYPLHIEEWPESFITNFGEWICHNDCWRDAH